jgi:hypothetical protein
MTITDGRSTTSQQVNALLNAVFYDVDLLYLVHRSDPFTFKESGARIDLYGAQIEYAYWLRAYKDFSYR